MPGSTPRDDHLIVLGITAGTVGFFKTLLVVLICSKVLEPLPSYINKLKEKKKLRNSFWRFLDYKQNHRNLCKQLNKIH